MTLFWWDFMSALIFLGVRYLTQQPEKDTAGLVRCCLQKRVTNDSTKQVSYNVVFLKLFDKSIIKLSGNISDFFLA